MAMHAEEFKDENLILGYEAIAAYYEKYTPEIESVRDISFFERPKFDEEIEDEQPNMPETMSLNIKLSSELIRSRDIIMQFRLELSDFDFEAKRKKEVEVPKPAVETVPAHFERSSFERRLSNVHLQLKEETRIEKNHTSKMLPSHWVSQLVRQRHQDSIQIDRMQKKFEQASGGLSKFVIDHSTFTHIKVRQSTYSDDGSNDSNDSEVWDNLRTHMLNPDAAFQLDPNFVVLQDNIQQNKAQAAQAIRRHSVSPPKSRTRSNSAVGLQSSSSGKNSPNVYPSSSVKSSPLISPKKQPQAKQPASPNTGKTMPVSPPKSPTKKPFSLSSIASVLMRTRAMSPNKQPKTTTTNQPSTVIVQSKISSNDI